jgi:hypothetical protein
LHVQDKGLLVSPHYFNVKRKKAWKGRRGRYKADLIAKDRLWHQAGHFNSQKV